MLNDFWKLNSPFQQIETQVSFLQILQHSKHVCNLMYKPNMLQPHEYPKLKIEDTIFENVSFSKTKIQSTLFSRCIFKDCLFIGVEFEECTIDDCTFKSSNMSYCIFKATYIQPDCLKNIFPFHTFSNIAISFYQSIYDSFKNSNQPELLRNAEYYFMKWNLIHTKESIKKYFRSSKEGSLRSAINLFPRFFSLVLQQFFGFGIKLRWYSATIIFAFLVFYMINDVFWTDFKVDPLRNGKHNVLFYTFYSFTSFGSSPMSPTSPLGIFCAMLQSFVGWIFIGVGISMIVKKFLR